MPAPALSAMAFDTPFGDLHVLATSHDETVRAAGFASLRDVAAHVPPALASGDLGAPPIASIGRAVNAWLDGDADALAQVPVALHGSAFFVEVWERLRTVPAGEAVTYQELAQMAGRPRAMRAVGTACARNTVGLFVPCHRVIASGGRLGGYGFGGPGIKARLLRHEGVRVADAVVTETSRVGGTADARVATAPERPAGQW